MHANYSERVFDTVQLIVINTNSQVVAAATAGRALPEIRTLTGGRR